MKIVLTGGGTAGHVTPNLALKEELSKNGYEICYIGSYNGIEKDIVTKEGIEYFPISSGKLRRYISFENIKDMFKVVKGVSDAYFLIKKIKPDVIFSKGGFVSCPVVWAGKLNGVPIVIHESDMTPGLANKLSIPCASKVCCAFPNTIEHLEKYKDKSVVTGIPVRDSILKGSRLKGLQFARLSGDKPVMLVMGGSLGSVSVNNIVRENLNELLLNWDIIHIVGKGNIQESLANVNGYVQYEYVNENMGDLIALSDLIVSRAGATAIFEIIASKKPVVFIPLPLSVSRGDQLLNAKFIDSENMGKMLEEGFTKEQFIEAITEAYNNKNVVMKNQARFIKGNSNEMVINIINSVRKK